VFFDAGRVVNLISVVNNSSAFFLFLYSTMSRATVVKILRMFQQY